MMLEYKISRKMLGLFLLMAALALGGSVLVMREALSLRHEIRGRTTNYVTDVSYQLTKDVDNQITDIVKMLASMGDSLIQVRKQTNESKAEIDFYLKRKGQTLGFDSFLLLDTAGRCRWTAAVPQTSGHGSPEEGMAFPGVLESFQGENGVTELSDGGILYSVPLKRDGQIVGVLGGVRSKEEAKSMVDVHSFSGSGTVCLMDESGRVIVSGEEMGAIGTIEEIFDGQGTGGASSLDTLRAAIKLRKSGTVRFAGRLPSGETDQEVLLAYHPLSIGGWYLVTLVPSNILVAEVNKYVNQTLFSIGMLILLTVASILLLFLAQKRHYQQMSDAIFLDPVTGGMNNAAFQKRCRQVLDAAFPGEYSIVLLHVKDFKLVNDQMGVEYGNQALRHIMWILEEKVKAPGFAARSFADNFYLLIREHEPERIVRMIQELTEEIRKDFERAKQQSDLKYQCIIQPGVYIVSEPGLDVTVMQDRAKAAGRNRSALEDGVCKFYDIFVLEKAAMAQEVGSQFESSIANGDFKVYFQPKVCLKDGGLGGAEALARWVLPHRGMISPGQFIPILEDNGKICELDLYIFRETCRTMERWQREGQKPVPVSVNISRRHFQQDGDFLEEYARIAKEF